MAIGQELRFVQGIAPVADYTNGNPSTDIINVEGYHTVLFVLYKGVGTTGTATPTFIPCSDTSASATGTALPYNYCIIDGSDTEGAWTSVANTGALFTAGSNYIMVCEVNTDEMAASGYNYLKATLTETDSTACLGGVMVILGEPRYMGAAQTTPTI